LYRLYEKQLPELKKLNNDFAHALNHAQTIVKRAKERFSPIVKLKRSRIELLDFLERVCQSTLPRNAWTATSAIGRVEMEMDAHLLEAAMLEMIENSRATHEDPDLLKIEIRIQCGGGAAADEVQIVYRNNGPKIPEETRHRIFEDFFSHRPGSERGSSGLGMGFIKRVIEAHGGRIEVGSPERGAEFIITLPRKVTNDHVEDTENINVSLSYR
jgi:signal transduction histidine kinase